MSLSWVGFHSSLCLDEDQVLYFQGRDNFLCARVQMALFSPAKMNWTREINAPQCDWTAADLTGGTAQKHNVITEPTHYIWSWIHRCLKGTPCPFRGGCALLFCHNGASWLSPSRAQRGHHLVSWSLPGSWPAHYSQKTRVTIVLNCRLKSQR